VKRYGQYGRKASEIVKRSEKYMEEREAELWKDMENMEEK
jgi:hypothetical protein